MCAAYIFVFEGVTEKHLRRMSSALAEDIALRGHSAKVVAGLVLPVTQRVVTASWDKTVKVWALGNGELLLSIELTQGKAYCLAVSEDEAHIVVGTNASKLCVFDTATGAPVHTFAGHKATVSAVAIAGSHRWIASGSWDRSVRIWGVSTQKQVKLITGHRGTITALKVSSNEKFLYSASEDSSIKVWNTKTWKEMWSLTTHIGSVFALDVSSDTTALVSGGQDGIIRLWRLGKDAPECVAQMVGHEGTVHALAFTSNAGHVISTGSDGSIRSWDLREHQQLRSRCERDGGPCVAVHLCETRGVVVGSYAVSCSAHVYPLEYLIYSATATPSTTRTTTPALAGFEAWGGRRERRGSGVSGLRERRESVSDAEERARAQAASEAEDGDGKSETFDAQRSFASDDDEADVQLPAVGVASVDPGPDLQMLPIRVVGQDTVQGTAEEPPALASNPDSAQPTSTNTETKLEETSPQVVAQGSPTASPATLAPTELKEETLGAQAENPVEPNTSAARAPQRSKSQEELAQAQGKQVPRPLKPPAGRHQHTKSSETQEPSSTESTDTQANHRHRSRTASNHTSQHSFRNRSHNEAMRPRDREAGQSMDASAGTPARPSSFKQQPQPHSRFGSYPRVAEDRPASVRHVLGIVLGLKPKPQDVDLAPGSNLRDSAEKSPEPVSEAHVMDMLRRHSHLLPSPHDEEIGFTFTGGNQRPSIYGEDVVKNIKAAIPAMSSMSLDVESASATPRNAGTRSCCFTSVSTRSGLVLGILIGSVISLAFLLVFFLYIVTLL